MSERVDLPSSRTILDELNAYKKAGYEIPECAIVPAGCSLPRFIVDSEGAIVWSSLQSDHHIEVLTAENTKLKFWLAFVSTLFVFSLIYNIGAL